MDQDLVLAAAAAAAAQSEVNSSHVQDEEGVSNDSSAHETYVSHTIRVESVNSRRRSELLPGYPLAKGDTRMLPLLCNVANLDRNAYEKQSFCCGNGVCPFEFRQYRYVDPIDSFMVEFYRDLFHVPSRRWRIDRSLIDYNLHRLRKCMDLYVEQTKEPAVASLKELPLALEFYLQIDVDMFFMKTCTFRGAQPRKFKRNVSEGDAYGGGGVGGGNGEQEEVESILCQAQPTARYGMSFCYQSECFLCESKQMRFDGMLRRRQREEEENNRTAAITGVHFTTQQMHRFVNKYEAILNCPANCLTANVIYALTCPCGKLDYINSTSTTFHDRILKHRDENNRVIREFLIGINNVEHMSTVSARSTTTISNEDLLLYQHSPRCSMVLQRFLDRNPLYWCLVPMSWKDAKADDDAHPLPKSSSSTVKHHAYANAVAAASSYQSESSTATRRPMLFEAVMKNTSRSEDECIWLVKGVPPPPTGFRFSRRQIDEQMNFFQYRKEAEIRLSTLIDCYKYTIVAVLPEDCSYELRRFIEALFITHVETRMNRVGNLTHKETCLPSTTPFDHSNRGMWCEKLVRS